MRHLFFTGLLSISISAIGQTIEVTPGAPLTIQGNLNLPTGFSLQYNNQTYLQSPATGSDNTYLGFSAGKTGSGSQNTFLGSQTGQANTTGTDNVFIGNNAGRSNTTGAFNLFVGGNAGQANTTGRENLYFGAGSGFSNTSGRFNTFVGINSGYSTTTGENNVFFGQRAGFSNTNGNFNLFIGASTGYTNASGVYNTFVGNGAGYSNVGGNNNTMIGLNAGFKTLASDNVSIGYNAGLENTSGIRNTFIGTGAGVSSANPNLQNATAIGYGALVATSNSVVLGAGANVGIGTSAPTARLHIVSGTANASGLRLESLNSSSPATGGQNKFLTVDGSGNVILGTAGSGGRTGTEDGLWVRPSGGLLKTTQDDAVVIGQQLTNTPAGYKLFVDEGILTERVKVAVKNTAEWSDYVFAPGYRLRPLAEVEQHIRQWGHLPGVPSARQMVEQGNDLNKTDAKLLEKLEELTLYSIEQQKLIEQQQQAIKSLQQQLSKVDELKQLIKQLMTKQR